MLDIPSDVWLHIGEFLPDGEVPRMLSVNSIFFNLAMDLRYREVFIDNSNAKTMWILSRLTDPSVSKRVRHFHVRRFFVEYGGEAVVARPESMWRKRMNRLMSHARRIHVNPWAKMTSTDNPSQYQKVLHALIQVFPGLVNVTEFSIDSWYLPRDYDLRPFLVTAWMTLGPQLQKLTLRGSADCFKTYLSSSEGPLSFNNLVDLELEFTNNRFHQDETADSAILLDLVAPLVNQLSPQLTHFKLTSWASLDFSAFFILLSPFPTLRHLSLRVPFNKSFRIDPSGLTRILCDHSNVIQHLELRLMPSGSILDPMTELPLSQWMSEITVNNSSLTNLRSLAIYPTALPAGFDALLALVRRSADTLTSLIVRDRYLTYNEVVAVVSILSGSHNLTSLRLNIRFLSSKLLDLLAKQCPALRRLSLFIGEIGEYDNDTQTESRVSVESFSWEMQERRYKDWKLYDLNIWQGGTELDVDTMHVLANCIPSLESFWCQGYIPVDSRASQTETEI